MTINGVAWASVIADYSGLSLAAYLTWRLLKQGQYHCNKEKILNRQALARMFSINHTIFVRTLCLVFAFAFFTAKGAEFGDTILAVNALLLNFQALMAYVLDSFAHAAEALVGHDIGEQNNASLDRTVKAILLWSLGFATLFSLAYWLAGSFIIAIMTNIESVRQSAHEYLSWLILLPLVSVWSFVYDGIFIGATRTRAMRDTMIISTFLVFMPAWYAFRFMGNHGLWLALVLFLAARGLSLGYIWHRSQRHSG